MVYDPVHKQVVLFGGYVAMATTMDETWLLNVQTWAWTKADPAHKPSARQNAQLVWDAVNSRVLLFGGGNLTDTYNDLWAWDGSDWTELKANDAVGSPGRRDYHAMSADGAKAVLYGGKRYMGGLHQAFYQDTWELDFATTTWADQSAATPGVRQQHDMAYDPVADRHLLIGGIDNPTVFWAWASGAWTQVSHSGSNITGNAALAWSEPDQRVMLITNATGGDKVYLLDGSVWLEVSNLSTEVANCYPSTAQTPRGVVAYYDCTPGDFKTEEWSAKISASTYADQAWLPNNRPFWFVHIGGFPYLWFTTVPEEWEAPTGWEYRGGLTVDETTIEHQIDPVGGIEDVGSCSVTIYDDLLLELFATHRNDSTEQAELASNDVAAGSDANLVTATEMTGAPSGGGTICIGNQTITYAARSGTTFSGVQRGRYAILDTDLTEIAWKPRIMWDAGLGVAPLVTVHPRTVRGRVLTLYRCYRDPDAPGSPALAKTESKVRWRGRIEAFGVTGDGLGYEVAAQSILDALGSAVMVEAPEHPLAGYVKPTETWWGSVTDPQGCVHLMEQKWLLNSADPDAWHLFGDQAAPKLSVDLSGAETIDDVIAAVNGAFEAAWTASPPVTMAPWYARKGAGGRIEIGYTPVGYDGSTLIPKETGGYSFGYGVYGWLVKNDVAAILGFGEPDGTAIDVTQVSGDVYRHRFAVYASASGSFYGSMRIAGLYGAYAPISLLAEDEAARAWMALDRTGAVPIDLGGPSDYEEDLADGGDFLVKVGDQIIYRASTVEEVDEEIYLKDAAYDYRHPLGTRSPPDDGYLSVAVTAPEDECPTARQVLCPTGIHVAPLGGGFYESRIGVHATMLQLMVSTGTAAYNGAYDIYPGGWGLAIPAEYVDVESFEGLEDAVPWYALQRRYYITKPTPLRDIIEEETKTLGFQVVQRHGKITARMMHAPCAANVAEDIDDDVRLGTGAWRSSEEGVINEVRLSLDYDWREDDYFGTEQFDDLASQTDTGRIEALEINNRGLRSVSWGMQVGEAVSEIDDLLVDRLTSLAQESYTYEAAVNRRADGLFVGDVVRVTDAAVPNPCTGTRGISDFLARVLRVSCEEATGRGQITVGMTMLAAADPTLRVGLMSDVGLSGAVAPALGVSAISGTSITVSPDTWGALAAKGFEFEAGELVQVLDLQTGAVADATVVSHVGNTVTVSQDLGTPSADVETTILTWRAWSGLGAAAGREKLAAFLADSDGKLGTDVGYRYC